MLLADFIRSASKSLEALYPGPEARSIALLLCQERLGVKSYTHIVEPSREIDGAALEEDLGRLLSGEPLQYVLGSAPFCSRSFKVGAGVLIPRPETEQLVSIALGFASGMDSPRILDLCTGSGCIAWTLCLDIPGARVVGVDISEQALEVARGQFEGPGPEFVCADIYLGPCTGGEVDILTANPPYVMEKERSQMRPNVLDYEPALALFVSDGDPLKPYRAISRWASELLSARGKAVVEINEALGEQTAEVFREGGFRGVELVRDLFGKPRFVTFGR